MKVAILCAGTKVFGMEKMAIAVARGLRGRGHEVNCIVSAWNDGRFIKLLNKHGISAVPLHLGKVGKPTSLRSLWYTANALVRLPKARRDCRRFFRGMRPDAVIVYNRDWVLQLRSLLAAERTVFHVHELTVRSKSERWVYQRLDRAVRVYVAASQFIAERLRSLGTPPQKIKVVPNGLQPAAPAGNTYRDRPITIGIVGQVAPWKGHEELLQALAILRARELDFRCLIFGNGAPDYIQRLKKQAAVLGLTDRLEFRGYEEDPERIYESLDVLTMPSVVDEAFGLAAAEAAMRAIPAVVSRRGALPEIVIDRQTGFVVPAEEAAAMANRLEILIDNPTLRREFGAAAKARAHAEFTAERMTVEIEKICAAAGGPSKDSASRDRDTQVLAPKAVTVPR